MNLDRLRGLFAEFLKEQGVEKMLVLENGTTIDQENALNYERIDKYRILFMSEKELKDLLKFCQKHGIDMWFGFGKLCVGYSYRGNMRLSAYASAPVPDHEIKAAPSSLSIGR